MLKSTHFKGNKEIPRLFSVVLDQGLMSITTLLTTIVLVRVYDKIDYADLVLLFSISIFVLGFQSSIISKPYAINLNDFTDELQNKYFHFNLNLKLVFTLFTCFVFPVAYYFSFDSWNSNQFWLFLLYVISYTSYYYMRENLLSERKTKQNLISGIICSFSVILLLSFIYFYKIQKIELFLWVSSLIYLTIVVVYFFRNHNLVKLSRVQYLEYFKINWKVGSWLLGSNFLFYISSSIYPWFLLYLSTKDNIATYAVLMSVAALINPILIALSSYLLPLFVKVNDSFNEVKSLTRKWQVLFGILAIILVIIGIFFGQSLVSLLFGPKYNGLGLLILFPFIYQAINVFFQPNKIALNAIKRTDINFYILIPRSLITLIIGYFLISKFGLLGVFYTMLTENIFYQLVYYITYGRIINTKLSN